MGVLPLFCTNNGFTGKKLVSVPFAVLGGICAKNDQAHKGLLDAAIEITKKNKLDLLELKHAYTFPSELQEKTGYFNFNLSLSSDCEFHWKNFHNEIRRCVRRGKETGLQLEYSNDISSFYKIMAIAHKTHGTPVDSKKWIIDIFNRFPDNHKILNAVYQGNIIASIMIREYKGTMSAVFGHVLWEYRKLYPLYVMYWHLIQNACENDFNFFNFGRSIQNSGTYLFKKRWGAQPEPLYYHYYFNKSNSRLDTSQAGNKRQLFAKIWKRLPLSFSIVLGPWLRRYFI